LAKSRGGEAEGDGRSDEKHGAALDRTGGCSFVASGTRRRRRRRRGCGCFSDDDDDSKGWGRNRCRRRSQGLGNGASCRTPCAYPFLLSSSDERLCSRTNVVVTKLDAVLIIIIIIIIDFCFGGAAASSNTAR
jgi:hypothetical protein